MRIFTLALLLLVFLTQCDKNALEEAKLLPAGSTNTFKKQESSSTARPLNFNSPFLQKGSSTASLVKELPPMTGQTRTDSTRIVWISRLRSSGSIPDLNEPVSREALLNPGETGKFPSMIELSRESFLKINFDNDLLNNTDMYYTNGMRIDLIFPFVQGFAVSKLLVPYWGSGTNYYGFSLFQNMYTPSTTKTGGVHQGDRPYAAYLCAGLFKITNDAPKRFRQTSEIDAGIIGSYSFGEFVQKAYHNNTPTNNEPLGWEYQIRNDLVLNYNVTMEKGILHNPYVELNVMGTGALGTLYTNLEGGFQFRTGLMNPYFSTLGVAKKARYAELGLRRTQVFFSLRSSVRFVGYDATLQGGMFNHSSPYTIPSSQISRVMSETSGGISFVINGFRIDAEQYLLSPEFHGGKWHFWVHAGITFAL